MNASQSLSNGTQPPVVAATPTSPTEPTHVQRVSASKEFSIAIGRALGTVVVTIHGEIDSSNARHLEEILEDLIENQENLRVVVDLHDVARLDPEAVTALLVATHRSHQRGGVFRVNEPSEAVYESLERAALAGNGMADVISLSDHPRRSTAAHPSPPPHPPVMSHHPSTEPGLSAQEQRAQGDSR